MPNTKWTELSPLQLGKYAEYYAKMEFASYGYDVYVIPATVWNTPNAIFVERNYDKPGQRSNPEWGISYSEKNKGILEPYKVENFFRK